MISIIPNFKNWVCLDLYERLILKEENKNPKDSTGYTLLHYAVENGHEKLSRMIINLTDAKNPKNNDGNTPLHYAALWGHQGICKMILDVVEDKKPKNKFGQTPLYYAKKGCNRLWEFY